MNWERGLMYGELTLLSKIAEVSGKNAKRDLLKSACADKRMQDLLDAALNYKRKFYIKKWDEQVPVSIPVDMHTEFVGLLQDLESQKYRGDTAKAMVEAFLSKCDAIQQLWYSAIIRKDLKAGFSIDSAVDCGFNIPIFEVQLAKDGTECKSLDKMLKDGLSASRKLDGYRCLAVVEGVEVTLYTRNGEEFHNFPSIKQSLIDVCFGEAYVFDGEIMSDDFNNTQKSAFASKRGTTVGDVNYHIFDMIPYDEWVSEKFKAKAFDRYKNLETFFQNMANKPSNLKLVDRVPVSTLDEILELEKQYIAEGYEGVMVNPNIPYYKGKKSNKMLKFKTFHSMDCKVVGVYEGKPGTKYVGTLGGLNVIQENGVTCDVGSGFSDQERDEIWNNPQAIMDRIVEIEYQELTKDDQRMRFPIKKRWRPDKDKR